jgi:hypothetical protein
MGHNAGIPIDSVLTIVDRRTGRVAAKLYQGGNCKTETCYVNEGFWMHPNADFVPVYTEKEFLILKQCVLPLSRPPRSPRARVCVCVRARVCVYVCVCVCVCTRRVALRCIVAV